MCIRRRYLHLLLFFCVSALYGFAQPAYVNFNSESTRDIATAYSANNVTYSILSGSGTMSVNDYDASGGVWDISSSVSDKVYVFNIGVDLLSGFDNNSSIFSIKSTGGNFKLNSMQVDAGNAFLGTSKTLVFKGFLAGVEQVSVSFSLSGSSGSVGGGMTYTKLATSGAAGGTLTFSGSSWGNLDEIRIVAVNAVLAIDDIDFSAPSASPAILTTGTLGTVNTTYGAASANTTFTVSGSNLTNDISVTAPTGYEVSTSSGSGFGNSVSLTQSSGTVNTTTIYVRLKANSNVGSYSGNVVCSSTGATTQNVATSSSSVSARSLSITANNANKTYGSTLTGGTGSIAFTSSGLQNSETIGSVTIAYTTGAGNGNTAADPVGTYTGKITPSAATGGSFTASNYSITYNTGNIIVGTASLTITANNANKTYGSTLTGGTGSSAFTSSGLQNSEAIGSVTIAYTSGAGNGNTAADPVGTYTGKITPSAATGGSFTASNYSITYNTGNIIIGTASLTITANNANKTYGSTLTGGTGSTAFTSSGLQNSEAIGSVTISYTVGAGNGNTAADPVGTYTGKVTPSAATGGSFTASNYSITYNTGNIIVGTASLTITANNANKTYGSTLTGGTGSTAFTSSGLQNSETIGSVTIAYTTGAGNGNTAADPVGTYTGKVTPSAATGGSFTASNYSITYNTGNIIVGTAPLTITANNANKTYGSTLTGGTGSTAFTSSGLQNSETIGSVTIAYTTGAGNGNTAADPVGTYTGKVTPSAATGGSFTAGNYSITYNTGNIIVGTAPLTITANNANKTYGSTLTGGTGSTAFTSSGLQNSETIGSVTIAYTAGAGNGNTAADPVGTYTGKVTPSAATGGSFTASNYSITYNTGNIIVGTAPLTVTATNANKIYGSTLTGGTGSTAFTSSGLQNSETIGSVTIAYTTGAGNGNTAADPVGTYTGKVTPSAATGGSFTASNYSITYNTGNIIVGTASLTITANNANKTYGSTLTGGTGSTAFTSSGLQNSETIGSVTIAYTAGAGNGNTAADPVGTYTGKVTPSAATGGSFTASNYSITYNTGNIIVGTAPLTITANNANKTYGSTLTGGTGSTAFTSSGLQNSEAIGSVTISYTVGAGNGNTAADPVGTYTGKVTPSAATGGSFTASNYSITYNTGNIIVGAASLTITANNANKTYGSTLTGGTGSTAFTSSGLQNSETIGSVTIAYTAGAGNGNTADDPVGTYTGKVTPSAATGGTFTASNYSITYNTGNIIVGAAPLTVTANNANKTYGSTLTGGTGSTAFTSSGLQNSETIGSVTIAYTSGAGNGNTAADPVGTYTGKVTPSAATGGSFTASNYSITYNTGNIIVGTAPLTITANNVNKTYGSILTGGAGSTAFTSTGLLNSETIGSVTITYTAGAGNGNTAADAVGTYTGKVIPGVATGGTFTAGNYNITYNAGNIIIGAAPLTITAANQNKYFGTSINLGNTAFSATGLVNGETIGSVTLTSTGTAATAAVNSYPITPSAATGGTFTAGNYNITYTPGTLQVVASNNANLAALDLSAGTLSPVFASGTIAYTVSVSNAITTVAFTPVSDVSSTTIKINNVAVASGTASGPIALNVGSNTVTIIATAGDGVSTKTYTVTVTRAAPGASSNANLSSLAVSSGTLSPVFASGTLNYAFAVPNATTAITVTPTRDEATATITVNGTTVASGVASGNIPLNTGLNTITVMVTAGDGTTTKTYVLSVTRALPSNANLSSLAVSSGTLSPAFASGTINYSVTVPNGTSTMTVTPTVDETTAVVTVNGITVTSGTASGVLPLAVGQNTISVVVTAGDGVTVKTYTITVTRAGAGISSNANLAALVISTGNLSPVFSAATTSYTATTTDVGTSVTLTPTAAEITSVIVVNGITVASGAGVNIPTPDDVTTIKTLVIAQDGTTLKTYTIAVGKPRTTWNGVISNAWSIASNWTNGVPDVNKLGVIPPSPTPPVISGNENAGSIIINSEGNVTITGSLQLAGNLTNDGKMVGTGVLVFSGSTAQTISGTGSIGNVRINNGNGVSIMAGAGNRQTITGILTMNAGTFAANNNLWLGSDAGGSAAVAPLAPGTAITGNVTVQRWMAAQRGYRGLGHPFNSALPLSQLTDNFLISGSGAGFVTGFGYSTASATYYDSLSTGVQNKPLSNAPNTSSTLSWTPNRGILVLVRGKEAEGLGGTYASTDQPSAFAADATGVLNQGALNDYVLGANATGTSFNLVGNPYAAPINVKLLKSNGGAALSANNGAAGVSNTIYVYNPFKNAGTSSAPGQEVRGGYDAYTNDGNADIIIPSFGAFLVQAKASGNVIKFDESVKSVNASPLAVMGGGSTSKITLAIENSHGSWDDIKLRWDPKAGGEAVDPYDGAKLTNELLDFYSISSDRKKLCIDSRSDSFNREEIIPLGIKTQVEDATFRIRVSAYDMPSAVRLFLRDKLLGTETPLSKVDDSYAFSLTSDEASKGDGRFELSVRFAPATPTQDPSLSDEVRVTPNPFIEELSVYLNAAAVSSASVTHVRLMDMNGKVLKTVDAAPGSTMIKLRAPELARGVYLVEVTNNAVRTVVKKVIKQ